MSRRQSAAVTDERVKKLENELADSHQHAKQLKNNLNASETTLKNMEKQLEEANSQLNKTKEILKSLERDADDLRSEKNNIADERDRARAVGERRDAEIEQLKTDILDLTAQLKKAIDGKCEALSKSDEILSKASVLEQKERRLEQDRVLLDNQIRNLTNDLNKYLLDIQNMQAAHAAKVSALETELTNKIEDLKLADERIVRLSEENDKLASENDRLSANLPPATDIESDMISNFKKELEAKTKLSQMYSDMFDESNAKCEDLANRLADMEALKNTLAEQKNFFENNSNTVKANFDSTLKENENLISTLRAEIDNINAQLISSKRENLEIFLKELTPSAATTCNLIKSKSLSQIYIQIVTLCDEISDLKKENSKLTNIINGLEAEVQEKSIKINQHVQDSNDILEKSKSITEQRAQLIVEINKLKDDHSTAVKKMNDLQLEKDNYEMEINDLSRQVCFLLQKVETQKNDEQNLLTDVDMNISKELVTFGDIQELQANNITLLKLVNMLKTKLKQFKDCTESAENKPIIDMLNKRIEELTYSQNHQSKILNALSAQCERYKKCFEKSQENETSMTEGNKSTSTEDGIPTPAPVSCKQESLQVELIDLRKRFTYQKEEYKKYRDEMLVNEKILTEQLEDTRSKLNELNIAYVKLASASQITNDKYNMLQKSLGIYKKQILSLEERNKIYNNSIVKQEETIKYLRDEVMESITKLTKTEVSLENFKQECRFLKDSEIRLKKERDLLRKERYSQSLIKNDIEYLKVTDERKDNDVKINLEIKLNAANKLCADLQKQIKLEQDKYNDMKISFERQLKQAETTLNESNTQLTEKKSQMQLVQEQLDVKTSTIEDLNKRMINLITTSSNAGNNDATKKIRTLESDLQDRQKQIETLQHQLVQGQQSIEESQKKYNETNSQLKKLEIEFCEYKNEAEINLKLVQESEKNLKDKALKLESEIKMQSQDITSMDSNDLKMELSKTRVLLDSITTELNEKTSIIDKINGEVERLMKAVKISEDKYAHEMILHSNDIQTLKDHRIQLMNYTAQVKQLKDTNEKYEAEIVKLRNVKNDQKIYLNENYEQMKLENVNLKNQNSILHEKLQQFNNKTSDESKSDDHLLEVIKFLKMEKNISDTKYESIKAENVRLKSELEILEKQFLMMKNSLEADRKQLNVRSHSDNSDLFHSPETLHALTDSNVALRSERDSLLKQVKELLDKSTYLDEQVKNIQNNNIDLSTKIEMLQGENINLKSEIGRWRTRVSALVEKANKTGSEDWKRLQNEREMLVKKLTVEKDSSKKLSDELLLLRTEKIKIEEQFVTLNQNIKNLNEDKNKYVNDMNVVKKDMSRITQELLEAKKSLSEKTEANTKMTESITTLELNVKKLNERDIQLRNMARKYKTQYETLLKSTETEGATPATPTTDGSLNKIDELQQNIEKNTALEKIIVDLKEKNNQEALSAKNNIAQLVNVNTNLNNELINTKARIEVLSQKNLDTELQLNNLKLKYDELLARFDIEKSQLELCRHNELTHMSRMEVLLQKIHKMENRMSLSKPSTSSVEETVAETVSGNTSIIGIATSDISSSLSSSLNITENLPSSSSTSTLFQEVASLPPESTQQDIELEIIREENEVSEDVESNQVVGQILHQAISSPSPRKETSLDLNRDLQIHHQQASSSSNNNNSNSTVTTSHVNFDMEITEGPHKRSRLMIDQSESNPKRLKIQSVADVDLEYEVPSSSQRDQEDDCCVIADSGEEDQYQETNDSVDNERKTEGINIIESRADEIDSMDNPVAVVNELDNNEVDIIENSNQQQGIIIDRNEADPEQSSGVGNPSTSHSPAGDQQISSVTEGRGGGSKYLTLGVIGGGVASGSGSAYDEGNDSIVPSTPVLYVPRRNDGFGEAVSSPVTTGRVSSGEGCFTFGEIIAGSSGVMDVTHADLTSQITPLLSDQQSDSPPDEKIDDGSQVAPAPQLESMTDEEVPTVSSQGSQPISLHRMDEGSEAEASTPVMRNMAIRSNWRRGNNHRGQLPNNRNEYNTRPEYNTRAFSQRSQRGGRPNRRPQNQYRRN